MVGVSLLLALLAPVAQPAGERVRQPVRYVTTLSVSGGKCRYWTGDTMVDAAGFRRDLRRRFDRRTGMTIVYSAEVPPSCTAEARHLLTQAGFTDVRLELGRVGPGLP